jgi:V8-like Glu-specific endopeptidase
MAKKLGNSAEAYLGTAKVASTVAIYWNDGTRAVTESKAQRPLNSRPEAFPGELGVASCRITCERDKADTNGQLALIAAQLAGTSVTLSVYPEGKTTGNEMWSGTAFVTDCGEVTLKNNELPGYDFKITFSGDITKGVAA